MDRVRPRTVACVGRLPDFLPLYGEAAGKTGGFVAGAEVAGGVPGYGRGEGQRAGRSPALLSRATAGRFGT